MTTPVIFDLTTRLGRRRARTAFVDRAKATPVCHACGEEVLGEKGAVVLARPSRPATIDNLRLVHALCAAEVPKAERDARTAHAAEGRAQKAVDKEQARRATEHFAALIEARGAGGRGERRAA